MAMRKYRFLQVDVFTREPFGGNPLADVQLLAADRLDVATLTRVCRGVGTDCVMVFSLETQGPEATVHTRMFAPSLGVPEDPATGSANGALGAVSGPPTRGAGERADHPYRQ